MQRTAVSILLTALCLGVSAPAQAQAARPAERKSNTLFLAISEGTSGGISPSEVVEKYGPLANVLSRAAEVPVVVNLVRNFDALESGIGGGKFDLVMARPADSVARGVRDQGYTLVTATKPENQCVFIVKNGSPLLSIETARGKTIMLPEKVSFMANLCSAELRDRGFDLSKESVKYTKEQGALGAAVENGWVDLGGVAVISNVAKNWEKKGHRIIHKSPPQPASPLIAHRRIPADKVAKMQRALVSLGNTEEGRKILKTIGVQSFYVEDPKRLLDMLVWLNKGTDTAAGKSERKNNARAR